MFPLDFEAGKEYDPLRCILALFQLHTLHWVQCPHTELSNFEELGRVSHCPVAPFLLLQQQDYS